MNIKYFFLVKGGNDSPLDTLCLVGDDFSLSLKKYI